MRQTVFGAIILSIFVNGSGCALPKSASSDSDPAVNRSSSGLPAPSSGGLFGWIPTFGLVRSTNPPRVPDSTGYHALQRGGVTGISGAYDVHSNRDLTAFQSGNINPLPEAPEIDPQRIDFHGID